MERHRHPIDRTVLYLGIHQILYPKTTWLVANPQIIASGIDMHEVIEVTKAHLSEQLDFGDDVHLRTWVLKVIQAGSNPIREWTAAPTGLRLTSINYQTGEVTSTVRDAEPDAPQNIPRDSNGMPRFRLKRPIRLAQVSMNQPVFIGLQQSLQPKSTAMVAVPEVLAIFQDDESVFAEVKRRHMDQRSLSALCTFSFWVLEVHQGWSRSLEKLLIVPDGVEFAEVNDARVSGTTIHLT